jgi:hypothetical protein
LYIFLFILGRRRHQCRLHPQYDNRDYYRCGPSARFSYSLNTFGLPEHNFRGTEAPVSPPATSILGNNTWQAAAYSLRISLGLAEESIALHASIKSAFYGN